MFKRYIKTIILVLAMSVLQLIIGSYDVKAAEVGTVAQEEYLDENMENDTFYDDTYANDVYYEDSYDDGVYYDESGYSDYVPVDEIPEEFAAFFNRPDYEVTQGTDESGNPVWYLINNFEGTRIKVSELNEIVNSAEEREKTIAELQEQLKKIKICCVVISIVAIVIIVILLIVFSKGKRHRKKKRSTKNKDVRRKVDVNKKIAKDAIEYEEL